MRPSSGYKATSTCMQLPAGPGAAHLQVQADGRGLRHPNSLGAPVLLFFQVRAPHAPSRLFAHHQFKYVDEP
jgi:hypothetical protein